MADQRRTGAEGAQGRRDKRQGERKPIPRDMPNQQWQGGPDRWDTAAERSARDDERPDEELPDEELPDTDESGTGKRGRAHSGGVHPDQPVPDEPPA